MIVTMMVDPSVDRTVAVDELRRGEVIRATASRVHPGGKGVTVAGALTGHAVKTRTVVLGGAEGAHLDDLLAVTGLEMLPVGIGGSIRSDVTVVPPDRTTTKLDQPGAQLSSAEAELLSRRWSPPVRTRTGSASAAACRPALRRPCARTSPSRCVHAVPRSRSVPAGRPWSRHPPPARALPSPTSRNSQNAWAATIDVSSHDVGLQPAALPGAEPGGAVGSSPQDNREALALIASE